MRTEASQIPSLTAEPNIQRPTSNGCGLTTAQILAIVVPLALLGLFCAIFLPIYLTQKDRKKKTKLIYIASNNTQDNETDVSSDEEPELIEDLEFDEFYENVTNYTYAVLTPKDGYDNIYIFLGGIAEVSNKYFDFFKSNSTIVPKGTKIYFLSGRIRPIKFVEKYNITDPVPCWFNVNATGKLICDGCETDFDQAKESLNIILDAIDRIAAEEKMSYDKIYLGGFSQGAIMTNYVMMNSRHELGGYTAFSGYFLDHNFPDNYVLKEFSDTQKQLLESRKNYHMVASHSFNDEDVPYPTSVESYYTYYKEFTDFNLYSFGELLHNFPNQPVLPYVRLWLKQRMGKE